MNPDSPSALSATSRTLSIAGILLLCSLAAPWPRIAAAESDGDWRYDAVLYLYLPTVGGTTAYSPGDSGGGGGGGVSVDSGSILDSLKMTFMGSMAVRRERWGAFTDFMYVDFGDSRSGTRDLTLDGFPLPADVSANVKLDLQGTMWTLAGMYRAFDSVASRIDLLAGARLLDITQQLAWQLGGNVGAVPVVDREGEVRTSLTSRDGIVGIKGQSALGAGRHWFVHYYADLGTGEARMTWQGLAGIGFSFGSGEIIAAWRYINYDLGPDSTIQSLTLNGPAIGVALRW